MNKAEQILHDLLDRQEEITAAAKIRIKEFISGINFERLADPADVEYDEYVRVVITGIVEDSARLSYEESVRTIGALSGGTILSPGIEASALFSFERGLIQHNIENDVIDLGRGLDRFLTKSIAKGMSPRAILDALERDLTSPRPNIFNDFLGAINEDLNSGVSAGVQAGSADESVYQEYPDADPSQVPSLAAGIEEIWICALIDTCQDCLPRHRDIRTRGEWSRAGRPGTGWSVCKANCKCILVPKAAGDINEMSDPLVRMKVKLKDGTSTGLTTRMPGSFFRETNDATKRQMRQEALAKAFESDIRVRRAFRTLGRQNADD